MPDLIEEDEVPVFLKKEQIESLIVVAAPQGDLRERLELGLSQLRAIERLSSSNWQASARKALDDLEIEL